MVLHRNSITGPLWPRRYLGKCVLTFITGLILAAGCSSRFGSDKRQAKLGTGRTVLTASVLLVQSQLSEVSVVLRPADDARELGIPDGVHLIRSKSSALGMGHSLASGIRDISEHSHADAVAVFLGDMPWISVESLTLLFTAAKHDRIVQPVFDSQPGHPVLFGRRFWTELLYLTGDIGAKSVIQAHPEALYQISLSDPGIIMDVDIPAALAP